jgi:putative transposase
MGLFLSISIRPSDIGGFRFATPTLRELKAEKRMPQYRRNHIEGGTYFFTVITYMRQPILDERSIPIFKEGLKECISKKPFSVEAVAILPDHIHCIWQLPPDDADYSSRWKFIKTFFTKNYFRFLDETYQVGKKCRVGGVPTEPTKSNQLIKPTASMAQKGEKGIWQRRFWEHTIRDERDYRNHCDYIHYNPVKHGLVKYPRDWPHSSFHEFVEKGLYPQSWGGPVNAFSDEVGGK